MNRFATLAVAAATLLSAAAPAFAGDSARNSAPTGRINVSVCERDALTQAAFRQNYGGQPRVRHRRSGAGRPRLWRALVRSALHDGKRAPAPDPGHGASPDPQRERPPHRALGEGSPIKKKGRCLAAAPFFVSGGRPA
jgi:hypothetical protein